MLPSDAPVGQALILHRDERTLSQDPAAAEAPQLMVLLAQQLGAYRITKARSISRGSEHRPAQRRPACCNSGSVTR
jgi:hypothetical protein